MLWTQSLVLAGYALGASVPRIGDYLLAMVAVLIVLSLVPLLVQARRTRHARQSPPR